MTRSRAIALAAGICLTSAFAGNELPENDDADSFEIEPPLLIQNLNREKLPDPAAAAAIVPDIEKLEKAIERAKRASAGSERLFRIGVLARQDVEQRALRIVRLQSDLENARLAGAKENAIERERRFAAGEITKDELVKAENDVERATQAAQTAVTARRQAELAAAEVNLQRQRKLVALGSGHKSDVAKAAQKLAELRIPNGD